MKRKIMVLLLGISLLSGCGFMSQMNQAKQDLIITNNGTLILPDTAASKLCQKADLDSLVSSSRSTDIENFKAEFSIGDLNNVLYAKNSGKYSTLIPAATNCQYLAHYYDFSVPSNWTQVATLNLSANDSVSISKLVNEKTLVNTLQKSDKTMINILVSEMLNSKINEASYLNDELSVQTKGTYKLIVKPIYRSYHFEDRKKINDYNFYVINSLQFKLEKK